MNSGLLKVLFILVILIVTVLRRGKQKNKNLGNGSQGEKDVPREKASPEKREEAPAAPPARFVYYTDRHGQKHVHTVATNKLNGRELSEYEIFQENLRLEALYARELEEAEARRWQERRPSGGESPDAEEKKPAAEPEDPGARYGSMTAETDFAFPSADTPVCMDGRETREQLEQLKRFLESGLIDKEEYRERKEKIQRGQ